MWHIWLIIIINKRTKRNIQLSIKIKYLEAHNRIEMTSRCKLPLICNRILYTVNVYSNLYFKFASTNTVTRQAHNFSHTFQVIKFYFYTPNGRALFDTAVGTATKWICTYVLSLKRIANGCVLYVVQIVLRGK